MRIYQALFQEKGWKLLLFTSFLFLYICQQVARLALKRFAYLVEQVVLNALRATVRETPQGCVVNFGMFSELVEASCCSLGAD